MHSKPLRKEDFLLVRLSTERIGGDKILEFGFLCLKNLRRNHPVECFNCWKVTPLLTRWLVDIFRFHLHTEANTIYCGEDKMVNCFYQERMVFIRFYSLAQHL
ncbi:hypothetical protein CEXT_692971 [Caerostris extrusa]|uniref:Uncharacterized protein n=1 Tax=Caerostris extrusa TaxID=172846 RepID=A0AAV4Y4Z1_CAEEX|nr:hypothetical protein CEXT_692971 [Caerostris extrusa]